MPAFPLSLSRSRIGHGAVFTSLLLSFLALLSFASAAEPASPPARNWSLPLFTPEGFRSVSARGSSAYATGENQFEVIDLNLTFFSGKADNAVETVILSPAATFLPKTKIARGEKFVRFIRDEVEASGVRWVYHHADKKISLDGNVRVTFRAEIKDLLR